MTIATGFYKEPLRVARKNANTGAETYQSPYYDRKFVETKSLKLHGNLHTEDKVISMQVLPKETCAQSSSKIEHERRIHTGNKPYQCKYCEPAFPRPSYKHGLDEYALERSHFEV